MSLLGEILVEKKYVDQGIIDEALRIQVASHRRLGNILVSMKVITNDQLVDVLSDQLQTPACDIAGSFSLQVQKTIPRYLCRQYGVLPLAKKEHNVLEIAMSDPSDSEAIRDLEHYTGCAIEPCLAKNSDIEREIPKCIPLTTKDFFSPHASSLLTRIIAFMALVIVIAVGFYAYEYIRAEKHGTISVHNNVILYSNRDLTVAMDQKGKYTLQGHPEFANGLYSVSFSDQKQLAGFIARHKSELSEKQRQWLQWAIRHIGKRRK